MLLAIVSGLTTKWADGLKAAGLDERVGSGEDVWFGWMFGGGECVGDEMGT